MRSGTRRYLALFARYVGPEWRRALLLAVLLLAGIALQLLNPQLLRLFIDQATTGAEVPDLARIALAFMGIALVAQLIAAVGQYVGEDLGWAATNTLRADLALHCLRLDLTFHKARTPGELIERVDGDVTALANFFSRFVVNVLANLVLLVGILVVVWREDVRAGLAFLAFAVIALVVIGRLRTVAVREWGKVREVMAQMYGFIGERLAGTEDIRSNSAEWHVKNGLALHHRAVYAARKAATWRGTIVWSSTIVTFALGHGMAFGVGGYLWVTSAATIGTVYLLFHYVELLRRPIEQLRRELEEVQRAIASIARIEALLGERTQLPDGRGVPIPSGALPVEVDRVSFAYETTTAPGDEPGAAPGELVLRDVTLRVAPGRTIGLLGRTGSGKTTLARLLMRFYDPASGVIRLGGVDAREAHLEDVRRRATLVSQDVQLFAASVRDNITFFDRSIDDARILAVLERIGLGSWLRGLAPSGTSPLDSELRAGALSAGEAQLLAFARVFLRDPGLVVLDEASSRLDPATERHIEEAIDALLADRTAIVIAHRLATVERCDDIVILEAGRVVEHGPRVALAADASSRFAGLLRTGLEQVLA
jgi:ATP-binding cassette, subfamily B, bacterial